MLGHSGPVTERSIQFDDPHTLVHAVSSCKVRFQHLQVGDKVALLGLIPLLCFRNVGQGSFRLHVIIENGFLDFIVIHQKIDVSPG